MMSARPKPTVACRKAHIFQPYGLKSVIISAAALTASENTLSLNPLRPVNPISVQSPSVPAPTIHPPWTSTQTAKSGMVHKDRYGFDRAAMRIASSHAKSASEKS